MHPNRKVGASFRYEADISIEQLQQHIMWNSDVILDSKELFMDSTGDVVPQVNGIAALHTRKIWHELELAIHRWSG
ncbi:hypothetical protein CVT25_007244 [Psilocybe cyanescens]|uniref:Uncharacterized protein n=1 Tax=Psilocybe cyanescens TaxID=93625 RepID=A0A409W800_PSICY|nr:hypothetical protein CVT25_007244 [Psilocybe cyanescens]